MRFFTLASSLLLTATLWGPASARAQAVPPPTFYTTYTYTAYTVYDTTSTDEPTRVGGVGGTLTLRPNGQYAKRLSIVGPSGPVYFRQDGTFALRGDSISFAFNDVKGHDVQRGTFRFDPPSRRLTITILGYPAGNKGVYELVAAPVQPAAAPRKPTKKTRQPKH